MCLQVISNILGQNVSLRYLYTCEVREQQKS